MFPPSIPSRDASFSLLPYSSSLPPSPRDSLLLFSSCIPLQGASGFRVQVTRRKGEYFLARGGGRQRAPGVVETVSMDGEVWEPRDTHLAVGGKERQHCFWTVKSHNLCTFKKGESIWECCSLNYFLIILPWLRGRHPVNPLLLL